MSAEKCGNPIAIESVPTVSTPPMVDPVDFLSGNAFRTLKRIRHKFPDFSPKTESDIWLKARSMGLTEEE